MVPPLEALTTKLENKSAAYPILVIAILVSWILIIVEAIFLFWITYNGTIAILGYCMPESVNQRGSPPASHDDDPPKVTVIVPAKNEEKVVERVLDKLVDQDYPNYEILIVEDGSDDRTPRICGEYAKRNPDLIKFYRKEDSEGKPSALNFGASKSTGEIIAVYDADTEISDSSALRRMVAHFRDPRVEAIQGDVLIKNSREGLLTRASEFESVLRSFIQHGKDRLNLFVSLCGTHQYVKREALESCGGWDPKALLEDSEISVRLTDRHSQIRSIPIRARQVAPSSIGKFVRQRVRWYRGFLQTLIIVSCETFENFPGGIFQSIRQQN